MDVEYAPGVDGRDEREESEWFRGLPDDEQERLHAAWAQATFYRVQANLQLTVDLVEVASGRTVWTHRFGTVESSGGSDARSNYQAAYKRALNKLAGEVADAIAATLFAEAMQPASSD